MVVVNVAEFDTQRMTVLVAKIANTKSQYDSDLTDSETYYKGYRYADNKRIAYMIVGDIYAECKFDLEAAKAKFLALNSTEIEPYIKKAVLESASADNWYAFEKQW